MSFVQRAAATAVILATFGLASVSSVGLAYDLNRTSVTTPAVTAKTPAVTAKSDDGDVADTTAPQIDTIDVPAYASLSEAVAAQDMPDVMDDDLRCLATAIYYESKGEPLSGQLAVADVIINRTESGRFPRSVCSVVAQPGQFSFVRGGSMPTPPENAAYRTAVGVAQVALDGLWNSDAGDALYFHARRVAPGWRMTRVASIGNHVFYR